MDIGQAVTIILVSILMIFVAVSILSPEPDFNKQCQQLGYKEFKSVGTGYSPKYVCMRDAEAIEVIRINDGTLLVLNK